MSLSRRQCDYNLLDEKWIPVLYNYGRVERVGIWKVLTEARKIRQLAASNPMDRVAMLRFLLAVLMWCKEDARSSLEALDKHNPGIPEEWLAKPGIPEDWLAKLEENKAAFNLLGEGKRFFQDESLKGKEHRPVGDLLVEFPGADSVNHMRHVVHKDYGLCPACCAMGILRLSVWAPANRYYPASVNPASAAYALIEGKNLFHTLCANLPETNPKTDQAPWLVSEQPESPDAVATLAWRPRKLWLSIAENGGSCAYCGQTGMLVKNLCIERGWSTPVTRGQEFAKDVLSEFQKLSGDYRAKKTDKRKQADKVVNSAAVIRMCRMSALSQADCNAAEAPKNERDAAKIARIFDQLFRAHNLKAIKELTKKPTEEEQRRLDQEDRQQKKFWIKDPHLLKQAEPIRLPDLKEDVALHSSRFWRDALRLQQRQAGKVTAVGPIVNKYTFQDCVSITFPDTSEEVKRRAELSAACSGTMRVLLTRKIHENEKQKASLCV